MNPHQILSDDDVNVVEFSENPGRRLRVQRQARGLEIERIAAQLHLRPAIIEALEQDRYGELPSPVFVAGYLRNYARLLGLDPDPLIAAYHAVNPAPQAQVPRVPTPPGAQIGSGHLLVRLISLALLVGVVAMLVMWWQDRGGSLDGLIGGAPTTDIVALAGAPDEAAGEQSPPEARSSDPGRIDSAPTLALPLASTPTETSPRTSGLSPTPALALTPPQGPAATEIDEPAGPVPTEALADPDLDSEAAAPAEAEPAAPAPAQVSLRFNGPCWIDVRDASGTVILNGEMKKGDQRVLGGSAPYSFVVGNARATTITVGGEPFDLESHAKGNVARFKLTPGGNG